jgi:hypothetical protein
MSAWTALSPLLGVVVGAILQHWFSRTAETSKQVGLLRSAAYVDYLRSIARLAHSSTREGRSAALVEAADVKARIAIYGTKSAVGALARFEEAGAVLDNPSSIECFVRFASVAGLSGAEPADLKLVLFGSMTGTNGEIPSR